MMSSPSPDLEKSSIVNSAAAESIRTHSRRGSGRSDISPSRSYVQMSASFDGNRQHPNSDRISMASARVSREESIRSYHSQSGNPELAEIRNDYWTSLVQYGWDEDNSMYIGRSKTLHHFNLTYLFNKLMEIKGTITQLGTTNDGQMQELGDLLHRYTEAVRDYRYLMDLPPLPVIPATLQVKRLEESFPTIAVPNFGETQSNVTTNDDETSHIGITKPIVNRRNRPYQTSYHKLDSVVPKPMGKIRSFIAGHLLPKSLAWTTAEIRERQAEYSHGDRPTVASSTVNRVAHFGIGLLGGFWLIIPLLIMAFNSNLTRTLVTVCVSVVLFALTMSFVLEVDDKEIVTATATYAAVLVVFVGTSTGGGGS